jgi:hypothetical protein
VTNSQLFFFNGGAGPLSLSPENQEDSCMTVSNNVLDIASCQAGDLNQLFTFGDALSLSPEPTATATPGQTQSADQTTLLSIPSITSTRKSGTTTAANQRTTATATATATRNAGGDKGIPNPTEAVPVSGAGGRLQPTAVAESHQRDSTATRAFSSVSIKSPDGKCLFVDPTAGDFRENLIPVSLVTCGGTPNEKFDIITAGKHNNAQNSALIVSSLVSLPVNLRNIRTSIRQDTNCIVFPT